MQGDIRHTDLELNANSQSGSDSPGIGNRRALGQPFKNLVVLHPKMMRGSTTSSQFLAKVWSGFNRNKCHETGRVGNTVDCFLVTPLREHDWEHRTPYSGDAKPANLVVVHWRQSSQETRNKQGNELFFFMGASPNPLVF